MFVCDVSKVKPILDILLDSANKLREKFVLKLKKSKKIVTKKI